ncbi:MAG: GGDEF domain-containing protein [Oscillospiraceae bacterium]|nr:GGDEF domain-containing protein [Oscillospiraceae bacterium]
MLLILREELICVIILVFLIFYYVVNKVKDKEMLFLKISCSALINIIFDILTVITVNNRDTVPDPINRALHICFYITGLLFAMLFYHYIIQLTVRYKYVHTLKNVGYGIFVAFAFLLLFLPMEYETGKGTDYSYGPLAFLGYALFLLYCTACLVMLLAARKRLDQRIRRALIPMLVAMYVAVILQAMIPELLMTGGIATIICIALFVALDNPDKDYMKQALWDLPTGLNNRNCYNRDLARYTEQGGWKKGPRQIGFVVADLNYLKTVNDQHGHAEGDKLIAAAAGVLRTHLKSAEKVYRLGGDEFVAIYLSLDDRTPVAEMEKVLEACAAADIGPVPLSIAMGYASGPVDGDIDSIFQQADQRMYEHKLQIKQAAPHLSPFR